MPEGTVVTVLAREKDETFDVPAEMEADLSASMAEADRGDTISATELLARLRRIAGGPCSRQISRRALRRKSNEPRAGGPGIALPPRTRSESTPMKRNDCWYANPASGRATVPRVGTTCAASASGESGTAAATA